ncbi:MAG: 4Fe-4S ferredoxin [Desulfobulbaceae bacterium]|nr:4Fe-4S ferredoxin [Desulfobulbaceae bacterium]
MKTIRKIIEIDEELCDGCGQCVPDCAEGSLRIIDGKACLVADKLCDGLGACLGSCPTGALKIIEREADEFDEAAVEAFLKSEQAKAQIKPAEQEQQLGCGCPSSNLQSFQAMRDLRPIGPGLGSCQSANTSNRLTPGQADSAGSALSHWPVQIRLIPANAPFLEDADLVVAADCTALAYANLHQDYITGRVVMMGCPKFDDQELYVERFTEIFRTRNIRSLTILIMEVPCCHAMLQIIQRALAAAKPSFPVEHVVISLRGEVQSRHK